MMVLGVFGYMVENRPQGKENKDRILCYDVKIFIHRCLLILLSRDDGVFP